MPSWSESSNSRHGSYHGSRSPPYVQFPPELLALLRRSRGCFMTRVVLFAFLIGHAFSLTANATEIPIIVPGGAAVPDYEATMSMAYEHAKSTPTRRSVLFHDGLSRVHDVGVDSISITHADARNGAMLRVYGQANGRLKGMSVENVKAPTYYFNIRAVRPTGRTEVLAGETCSWHEVSRRPEREKFGPIYFSCITGDGIDIGERVMSSPDTLMAATTLTTLTRRPVKRTDVLPKAEWFEAAFWLTPDKVYDRRGGEHPDFVMSLEGRDGQQMTWKRRYPWNHQDIRERDGSRVIKVWNEKTKQGIYFSAAKGGVFRSLTAANPVDPTKPSGYFGFGSTPKAMTERETVIGEDCQWFDMTPGMMDASQHQCMTKDDIALKILNGSGWGRGSAYEAIALMRRDVAIEEIMPPADIFDPGRWGFDVVEKP
ncbi:hypothetical protein [Rhizobium sp.]